VEHKTNAIQLNRSTEWHFFLSQRSNIRRREVLRSTGKSGALMNNSSKLTVPARVYWCYTALI